MTQQRRFRFAATAFVLVLSFIAGQVSAGSQFASFINKRLVNAFSSVGQNLFGEAAFETAFVPPNPTQPFQIVVDPDVAPDGDDTLIVFESLAAYRPSLARCEVPSVDVDP